MVPEGPGKGRTAKARKSAPAAPVAADWETIPLDLELPATGTTIDAGGRTKPPVAYAKCSKHIGEKRTGLQRTARHLVYRQHWIVTWNGSKIPCPSSGVALCDLPDATGEQFCDCERRRKW